MPIDSIDEVFFNVATYLTPYELHHLSLVSKFLHNKVHKEHTSKIIWNEVIENIHNFKVFLNESFLLEVKEKVEPLRVYITDECILQFEDPNLHNFLKKLVINLDGGVICDLCFGYKKCIKGCETWKNISKTQCFKQYILNQKDLSSLLSIQKYNYAYRKYTTQYNHWDVKELVVKKYGSMTNVKMFITLLEEKKKQKKLNSQYKKNKKYNEWKTRYLSTFDYTNLTNQERDILLRETLNKYIIPIPDEGSINRDIYMKFVNGETIDKCTEHTAALIVIAESIFNYRGQYELIIYKEQYFKMLIEFKMKNEKKVNYTWISAAIDTIKKMREQLALPEYDEYYDSDY